MARKRSSKGKIAAKAKSAPKKKVAAKGKVAAKKKVAAKPRRTPPPPTLLGWENQLSAPSLLPAIRNSVTTIVVQLGASDHNRGPVTAIDEYIQGMIDELTSPSAAHTDEMRRCMNRIVELEPSVSPDQVFRKIPTEPGSHDDYTDSMCEQFMNAWTLTWDIYARMGGSDRPTPPTAADSAGKIPQYATDILTCLGKIQNGDFLRLHQRKQSKS